MYMILVRLYLNFFVVLYGLVCCFFIAVYAFITFIYCLGVAGAMSLLAFPVDLGNNKTIFK